MQTIPQKNASGKIFWKKAGGEDRANGRNAVAWVIEMIQVGKFLVCSQVPSEIIQSPKDRSGVPQTEEILCYLKEIKPFLWPILHIEVNISLKVFYQLWSWNHEPGVYIFVGMWVHACLHTHTPTHIYANH